MEFLVVLLVSYLLGAIPFGLIIAKVVSGKDVRQVESGRTGGTNVWRVAGFWAGALTALMDIGKGTVTVYLARAFAPATYWLHALAPVAAVLGHNYSLFLIEHKLDGKLHLRGGAGGATALGGAIGLWWPSLFIILPVALIIWIGVGYASLTTLSIGLLTTLIFTYRSIFNGSPWAYVYGGLLIELCLVYALRPNIKRLLNGSERLVGLRANRKKAGFSNALPTK